MAVKSNKDLNLRIKATNETGAAFGAAKKAMKDFAAETEKVTKSHATQVATTGSAWSSFSNIVKNAGSVVGTHFNNFTTSLGKIASGIYAAGAALIDFGMKLGSMLLKGVMSFIEINAEFEKMKVTLDTVTRGKGEEWFNKLNTWALDMPISLAEVTKSFTVMKAYGLDPTIKMMETLIDTASVLPDSGRAMAGIARALGQITSKGRLEGQELRQLAEWAVPGYEAVYTKIFKKISEDTGKSVGDLKFTMIDAATFNKAMLETMQEHFGGAAKKMAKTWDGLKIRLINYTKEFVREVGESGAFDALREKFESFVNYVANTFKSGEMQGVAASIGSVFGDVISALGIAFGSVFQVGGKKDLGERAKEMVAIAIKAFYELLKFIAY